MNEKNNIDGLFRDSLYQRSFEYKEDSWMSALDALEKSEQKSKKTIGWWWLPLSLLLLTGVSTGIYMQFGENTKTALSTDALSNYSANSTNEQTPKDSKLSDHTDGTTDKVDVLSNSKTSNGNNDSNDGHLNGLSNAHLDNQNANKDIHKNEDKDNKPSVNKITEGRSADAKDVANKASKKSAPKTTDTPKGKNTDTNVDKVRSGNNNANSNPTKNDNPKDNQDTNNSNNNSVNLNSPSNPDNPKNSDTASGSVGDLNNSTKEKEALRNANYFDLLATKSAEISAVNDSISTLIESAQIPYMPPAKPTPEKQPLKKGFRISLAGGMDYNVHKVKTDKLEPNSSVNRRKTEEKGAFTPSVSLHATYNHRAWQFGTGVNYGQWGEMTDYANTFTKDETTISYDSVAIPISHYVISNVDTIGTFYTNEIRIDTNTTITTNVTQNISISKRQQQTRISYLEIPLFVGYRLNLAKRWELGFQTGLGIGVVVAQKGYLVNTENDLTAIKDSGLIKNTHLEWSWLNTLNCLFHVNDRFSLMLRANTRSNLNSMTSFYGLRYTQFGVQFGGIYNF